MLLKQPCPHGRYEEHYFNYDEPEHCPGGVLLPPDSLVVVKEDGDTIDRAAEALYNWDDDSGSVLIPWRYEGEAAHKEHTRDYYRQGVKSILDALAAAQPGRDTVITFEAFNVKVEDA